MPSANYADCFLALTGPFLNEDDDVWTWPDWQALTGLLANPAVVKPASANWTDEQFAAVQSYIAKRRAVIEDPEEGVGRKRKVKSGQPVLSDNDALGKKLWDAWIKESWEHAWAGAKTFDRILAEHELAPTAVIKRMQTTSVSVLLRLAVPRRHRYSQLPSIAESNVSSKYNDIAMTLFGPECLYPDSEFARPLPIKFVSAVVVQVWNNYRKQVKVKFQAYKRTLAKVRERRDGACLSKPPSRTASSDQPIHSSHLSREKRSACQVQRSHQGLYGSFIYCLCLR